MQELIEGRSLEALIVEGGGMDAREWRYSQRP